MLRVGGFMDEFAAQRKWAFDSAHPLRTYITLQQAWQRSQEMAKQIEATFLDLLPQDVVSTVAVSGSLGRMECLPHSDVDLIVILNNNYHADEEKSQKIVKQIWDALGQLGFPVPKANGIFAQATTRVELCNPEAIGQIDEQPALFGKRIQLLLDSQPLFGKENFLQLQAEILDWYQISLQNNDPAQTNYLVHDLHRYQRALAIRYQFLFRDDPLEWRLLNLKFRNSRFLNHFGLLLILGEMGVQPVARTEWLRKALFWTPLERIAAVYARRHDANFHVIARSYERFLDSMGNTSFRKDLQEGIIPEENEAYQAAIDHSRLMNQELARFLSERQHDWNESFLETLSY